MQTTTQKLETYNFQIQQTCNIKHSLQVIPKLWKYIYTYIIQRQYYENLNIMGVDTNINWNIISGNIQEQKLKYTPQTFGKTRNIDGVAAFSALLFLLIFLKKAEK